jgi:tryptophan synthase alpha chain
MTTTTLNRHPRLMAHLIAHYPSAELMMEVAQALVDSGADYLEVQFPFSDPSADGPVIQKACTTALKNGFSVSDGFSAVGRISKKTGIPVFIMSYASIVYARGVSLFCRQAAESGAVGLIIPDLTPGDDEGLYEASKNAGISSVPVIIPQIAPERLSTVLAFNPQYVYASLRAGVTGPQTEIDDTLVSFLRRLSNSGTSVLAGFGIREQSQVEMLGPHVHALVIGSALTLTVTSAFESGASVGQAVKRTVYNLFPRGENLNCCSGEEFEAEETQRRGNSQGC